MFNEPLVAIYIHGYRQYSDEVKNELMYPSQFVTFVSLRDQLEQEVKPCLDNFYRMYLQVESA